MKDEGDEAQWIRDEAACIVETGVSWAIAMGARVPSRRLKEALGSVVEEMLCERAALHIRAENRTTDPDELAQVLPTDTQPLFGAAASQDSRSRLRRHEPTERSQSRPLPARHMRAIRPEDLMQDTSSSMPRAGSAPTTSAADMPRAVTSLSWRFLPRLGWFSLGLLCGVAATSGVVWLLILA